MQFRDLDDDWETGFINEGINFFDAILGKAEPVWNLVDSRRLLQTALAVGMAAEQGGDVDVDSVT